MTPRLYPSTIATTPGEYPRPVKRATVTALCPNTGRVVDVPTNIGGGERWTCECGNCGAPRTITDQIVERCANCGDDEIDLSVPIDVP